VATLVDFYHLDEESEPIADIRSAGSWIAHVHTADTGRRPPGTGNYDYEAFFGALKAIDYDARVSVECVWGDFEREARASVQFLRRAWKDAT